MENNNAPLLEMRNIKKDFFGNQVLSDINITLKPGEVLGLVGENGAGKSTLMKILFGMDVIRETGGNPPSATLSPRSSGPGWTPWTTRPFRSALTKPSTRWASRSAPIWSSATCP